MRFFLLCALALLSLSGSPINAHTPAPGEIRVRLNTSEGAIIVAVDTRRAPKTAANFLAYVDDGRLDGTTFYRAARRKSDPKFGFIQGGISNDARRMLPSVPLESTSATGLRHLDGSISMAHGSDPNSATGNFSIMVGANPGLAPAAPRRASPRSATSSAEWMWSAESSRSPAAAVARR